MTLENMTPEERGKLTRMYPVLISSMPKEGKALKNSATVYTPTGKKQMGDLKVDDLVIDYEGKPTKVLDVFPQGIRDIYTVTFIDGTSVDCDLEHRWEVFSNSCKCTKVLTVAEMLNQGFVYPDQNGRVKFGIPTSEGVRTELDTDKDLPLDPYLLGLLLGDGSFTNDNVRFTNGSKEIIDEIAARLPKESSLGYSYYKGGAYHINITGTQKGSLKAIISDLGLFGHKSISKFIPEVYKNAGYSARKAIVQGLIDTDGYMLNGILDEYSSSSKQLAYDFLEMARSIGMHCSIISRTSGYKKEGVYHACSINYRVRERKTPKKLGKAIINIEYSHKEEATCITVDSPRELFLTDGYNLTHNTSSMEFLSAEDKKRTIYVNLEGKNLPEDDPSMYRSEVRLKPLDAPASDPRYVDRDNIKFKTLLDIKPYFRKAMSHPEIDRIVFDSFTSLVDELEKYYVKVHNGLTYTTAKAA